MLVETTFDFRTDARTDDPDQSSPTLRRYHQLLWSKPLPSGHAFDLDVTTAWTYLHHSSDIGEYFLSSDSVIATYSYWQSTAELMHQLPKSDVERFEAIGYTIGGMMIFPSNRVDGKHTINMARGMNRRIADRMDMTLECVRRYYSGDIHTPLGATLARYDDFFALFNDFRGYVDFFLLQDLLIDGRVKFFTDFDNFATAAVPGDLATYTRFRDASIAFVVARNERIESWVAVNLSR
ncbi:DUF6994 family protein [Pengzhenrongella phosphoraccumulans]|uniref:DUF6994 family protein n=1 Tax=Pengzhenrongella phosphoraccumulans TaxID=3114394 RepID=UPI00388DB9B2